MGSCLLAHNTLVSALCTRYDQSCTVEEDPALRPARCSVGSNVSPTRISQLANVTLEQGKKSHCAGGRGRDPAPLYDKPMVRPCPSAKAHAAVAALHFCVGAPAGHGWKIAVSSSACRFLIIAPERLATPNSFRSTALANTNHFHLSWERDVTVYCARPAPTAIGDLLYVYSTRGSTSQPFQRL